MPTEKSPPDRRDAVANDVRRALAPHAVFSTNVGGHGPHRMPHHEEGGGVYMYDWANNQAQAGASCLCKACTNTALCGLCDVTPCIVSNNYGGSTRIRCASASRRCCECALSGR